MISAWVVGTEEVKAKLDAVGPRVMTRLRRTVDSLALRLMAFVKASKLSGEVLNVRTGTLRRSINRRVNESGTAVIAQVGTNVVYAAPHEYGFHGTVTVRAHVRRIKQQRRGQLKAGKNARTEVLVRQHSRKVDLPERSFLRSSLREMGDTIKTELEKAVRDESQQVMK